MLTQKKQKVKWFVSQLVTVKLIISSLLEDLILILAPAILDQCLMVITGQSMGKKLLVR
jgi:hypothetical protein